MSLAMMEVRCCCHPKKLLGWVPVPKQPVIVIPARVVALWAEGELQPETVVIQQYELRVEQFNQLFPDGNMRSYYALKAEDVPIEVLRSSLPGFIENPEEQ